MCMMTSGKDEEDTSVCYEANNVIFLHGTQAVWYRDLHRMYRLAST
jgi:hypothetical protein